MSRLNVVLFNSAEKLVYDRKLPATKESFVPRISPGQTPNIENFREAVELSTGAGIDLRLFLVDPGYTQLLHVKLDERLLDERKRLRSLMEIKVGETAVSRVQIMRNANELRSLPDTEETIFVSFYGRPDSKLPGILETGTDRKSSLEIMIFMDRIRFDNCWYLAPGAGAGPVDVKQLVQDRIGGGGVVSSPYRLPSQPFNLFIGGKIPADLSPVERRSLLVYGVQLCRICATYLRAGFMLTPPPSEIKIPSFMANMETPSLRGIIDYYGIKPTMVDWTPAMSFRDSALYRRALTDAITRVLAQLIVNNNLVSSITSFEQPELYESAASSLERLLG